MFELERFVDAQATDYPTALAELKSGRKRSHWIWYVFPQLRGLGVSHASHTYGIAGLTEARAYLDHPILGPRLRECVATLLGHAGRSAAEILGDLDATKLRSCLTLFMAAAPNEPLFTEALRRFYGGELDPKTVALLGARDT